MSHVLSKMGWINGKGGTHLYFNTLLLLPYKVYAICVIKAIVASVGSQLVIVHQLIWLKALSSYILVSA